MRVRIALLSATFLALPLAAHAQMQGSVPLGYPITGLYVGAAGGPNLKVGESVNNIHLNTGLGSGFNPSNLNLNTTVGGGAVGEIGYGFGNGFRVEIQGDYLANSISGVSNGNAGGFGRISHVGGSERLVGPMVNVLYDFVGLSPMVVPYVGVGVGYQWARLNSFSVTGSAPSAFVSAPVLTGSGTEGSFAAQGILGVAFPFLHVPGMALTAEYHILALTGNRTYSGQVAVSAVNGASATAHGSFRLGSEFNNMFLFGVRYNFGVAPPPAPAPAPVAAPAPAPARSYLVFFDWDKATLTNRAREIIREAAENSTRVQYTRIQVNGYTDTSGTPRYNLGLSIRRAKAVQAELIRDGVPPNVISIHGYGETHLLVPTGPGVREPQNRRVEIILE